MNKLRWLLAITILGGLLRFWGLGKNPPGLYWDEVSLGWNAYSVQKTGYDEHGRFLPLDTFFAFGDYKPPLYIYAVIPAIWLFGLNEFAVRLPSALSGTLLILVTYFLAKAILSENGRISENRNIRHSDNQRVRFSGLQSFPSVLNVLPLIAAFLVAISPWSITLSRVAFESNLAVLFNAAGILFFLYAVKKSPKWLLVSVLSFVLAAYTFNANRLLSPMYLIVLTLIYFRKAVKNWKWWLGAAVLSVILVLPMVGHLRSPAGKLRWNEVNIFSDLSVINESNQRREVDGNTLGARILHHRYLGFARLFWRHYLDNFNLNYLFVKGDPNPRISIPDMGQIYLIELPFFVMGLISLMGPMRLMATREKLVIFLWLLLASVPAGLARETPHALRSASTLPVPQIIVAFGLNGIINKINSSKNTLRILLFAFCFLLFASVGYFQLIYWRYYPNEWAGEWLTSYKPLVSFTKEVEKDYKTIYVTPDLGRPYVYFLFYDKYDPARFIREAKSGGRTGDSFGFFNVNSFDKYKFYIPSLESISPNELVITRADPPPDGFELLKTIGDTNGYPQFSVIRRRE